jgi:hypothetical protein
VTELERIKDKRATILSAISLCIVGEKHMKKLGALLRMNFEFT